MIYSDDIFTADKRDWVFAERLLKRFKVKRLQMNLEEKMNLLIPAFEQKENECTSNCVAKCYQYQEPSTLHVAKNLVKELWKEQKQKPNCREALKAAKRMNLIKGFARLPKNKGVWERLLRAYSLPILCHIPRKKGAWKKAEDTGFLTLEGENQDTIGHRVVLFHASPRSKVFYGINSHGAQWGFFKNGLFILPYSEFKYLRSDWQFIPFI